jgi:phospholipid/cholesterol/gamma-HCH transport system substrate-binding protein
VVKQAPTLGRLLVMVFFALSCFGLLLFLWLSFGGVVPLQPKGYRFTADFSSAVQLSEQADVRISGVNVGKVVKLTRETGSTRAVIQLDAKYAPLPKDSLAMLRSKTLLGETYVALTPGSRDGPKIPEGGALPAQNVKRQIELDEVLRAFDPPTRRAMHQWFDGMASALEGRSADLSSVLGNLAPTAENGTALLEILDSQQGAVRRLVSDSGQVFSAIGSRSGDVQSLITSGNRLFATTASRQAALSETIRELPPFLTQTRATLRTAQAASREAAPLIRALKPVAPLVPPALRDASALAPDLESLFKRTDPVITLSRSALPAATKLLRSAQPLVRALLPVSEDLVPAVRYLGAQRDQIVASLANIPAVLNASEPQPNGTRIPYLRAITYFASENLVGFPKRLPTNRRNPYLRNRGLDDLNGGGVLKTSDCDNLGNPDTAPEPDSPPPCIKQGDTAPQFSPGMYPHLTRDHP